MYSYEDPVLTKSKKRKYSQQAPKETTPSALSVGKWGHDKWDEGSQLGRSDTNQAPKRQKLTPSAQAFSVSQWTPGCAEWPTLEESAEPLLVEKFKVLDVKSLINAINTLAKIMEKIDLGSADARQIYNNCISSWIEVASSKLQNFDRIAFANSISALVKLGYYDRDFIKKWIDAASNKLEKFYQQELSNSMWALAKLGYYDEDFTKKWLKQAIYRLSGFNAQGLTNSIWALATLVHYDRDFIKKWIDAASNKLGGFNEQGLANSIWALAKLGYKDEAFIEKWLYAAHDKLYQFNEQELVNSIWALATLVHYDEAFIQEWRSQAIKKLSGFNERGLSNSMLALANLEYYDQYFIQECLSEAIKKLDKFNAQELVNSIWALAKLEYKNKAFIQAWLNQAIYQLDKFNAQNFSNSIWALATLGYYDEEFIQAWLNQAIYQLDEFNEQNFSNSIWALAKLGYYDEAFTKKWIDAASNKLGGFNEQGLSNSIWALAKLVHYDEAFIQEWLAAASNKLDEFNEQGLSNSIWALATLGYDNQYFIQQWLDTASNKLGGFNAQDLANSIWALAHFYIHEEDSDIYNGIKRLMKKVDEVIENVHQEPTTCKRQVAQAFYLLNRQDQQEFKAISERLEAWHNDFKQEETTISQHQKKVFDCEVLKQCKQEYYIDEVCGRVDGYLQRKLSGREYDIIVQVDEPSHFNIDSAGQESYNLQTLFNNYILEQYGYMLLRLSYKEIDARSPEDLNDYISKKIPNLIDYKVKVTNDVALSANKPFVVLTCLHDCPIFNMPYLGEVLPKNNQAAGIVGENQIINLLNFMDSSFHRNENLPHSGTGDGANSIIIETKHNNSAINTFFNQPAIKSLFFTLGAFNYNKIGQVIEHFGCELTIIYRYTTPDGHKASYVGRFGKALSNNNDTVIGDITQSLKNLTFNALEPIHVDESFAYINLVPVSRDPITLISDENGFRVASEEEIREQALREIAQSGVRVQVNEISVEHVGDFTLKDLVFEMVTM